MSDGGGARLGHGSPPDHSLDPFRSESSGSPPRHDPELGEEVVAVWTQAERAASQPDEQGPPGLISLPPVTWRRRPSRRRVSPTPFGIPVFWAGVGAPARLLPTCETSLGLVEGVGVHTGAVCWPLAAPPGLAPPEPLAALGRGSLGLEAGPVHRARFRPRPLHRGFAEAAFRPHLGGAMPGWSSPTGASGDARHAPGLAETLPPPLGRRCRGQH